MSNKIPTQAKVWQYRKTAGGLETHLELNTIAVPKPKQNQHLVRVIAASLNPVDYKIAEAPVVGSLAVSKPATPGVDIAGEIVTPASGSDLKAGTLVFGASNGALAAAGGLAEYALMSKDQAVPIPQNVSPADAASLPVVAVTATQALVPYVKKGDHVFINGGSGGVGVIAIQIAKIFGCHVTVTCSARNIELCKSLGADEVVDYTAGDVVETLSKLPYKIDHVIDGVGSNRALYWYAHRYTTDKAAFINIAFAPTVPEFSFMFKALALPSFLGGSKKKLTILMSELKAEDLQKAVTWLSEGKMKAVIDSRYTMSQVPEAFKKMKTSRARGKIVVDVAP